METCLNQCNVRPATQPNLDHQAGLIVNKLYEALLKSYPSPDSETTLHSLNKLCVQLIFCLYAERSGFFPDQAFTGYLEQYKAGEWFGALATLFNVLNTPVEQRKASQFNSRSKAMLTAFPYVGSGLFSSPMPELPRFDERLRELILREIPQACAWGHISSTLFSAVFESTLTPVKRRQGGMHYTSIENIHKVVDPLFLNDLQAEFERIKSAPLDLGTKHKDWQKLHLRLSQLTFLDPACGSGNFLTEAYISLRRLEDRIIREQRATQLPNCPAYPSIMVNIDQFYGIELNDLAAATARTSLWMAQRQLQPYSLSQNSSNEAWKDNSRIKAASAAQMPKNNFHIIQGNALRLNWSELITPEQLNYILGNPPFVGYFLQSKEQKQDLRELYRDETGKPYRTAGKIDYAAGWYWQAARLMQNTTIKTAFVSTNSITQGEQVDSIWRPLYERFKIQINFAHRTFQWDSSSGQKARVHCVIVGFSCHKEPGPKMLYTGESCRLASSINPYLLEGPMQFIQARAQALCPVPAMQAGIKPTENGNLLFTAEEKDQFLKLEPGAAQFIRPFTMSRDFIERRLRYCLWLVKAQTQDIEALPLIGERLQRVRAFRLASSKAATRQKAATPHLFDEIRECSSRYIAVPVVSSGRRRYIPIDYLPAEVIPGAGIRYIEGASLYHFGVLTSSMHMAWMRIAAGRLKSDYNYSNTIVYNTFPWPNPTPMQKKLIEQTAQAIFQARALYPKTSFSFLYDEQTMPDELKKAHEANDQAVLAAYGLDADTTESECLSELMKLYQQLSHSNRV